MRADRLVAAAAAAALLACAAEAPAGPAVTALAPRVGYAGRAVPVRVAGQGFLVAARRTADGDADLDAGYRAWLGGAALRDVRWVDAQTLVAQAPGTIAPGVHDLVVEDPYGARAVLTAAFECLAERPPELRAALQVSPAAPRVGETVAVTLDVENAGEATALAVAPDLPATDAAVLSPAGADASAADLPGGAARRFSWTFGAVGPGERILAASAHGTDVHTGEAVAAPSATAAVRVSLGPRLAASASLDATSAVVGDVVRVIVVASNEGDVAVDPVSATVVARGTAALELLSPAPVARVGPGGSQDLSAAYRVRSAGTLAFDVAVEGLDAERLTPIAAPVVPTETIDASAWPALEIASFTATPARANRDQTITVQLTVRNAGTAAAANVHPSALGVSAPLAAGPTAPVPASATLAPGETSGPFVWTCAAAAAGTLTLVASAAGTDAASGAALADAPAATAQVEVQEPAAVSLEVVSQPVRVNTGAPFTFAVRARNGGGAAARGVVIELSAGGVARTFAVGDVVAGTPSDPVSATFQAPPQRGSVDAVARIVGGTDANDGLPLLEASLLRTIPVDDPAKLVASLSMPAAIAPGASVPVTLAVTNVGDARAVGVVADGPPSLVLPDSTTTATVLGAPTGGGVTLARGESTTIVWTVVAGDAGALRLVAGARATDANDDGERKAAATSGRSGVAEAVAVAPDPFGDGATAYARIAAYGGALWLGPSHDGTHLARVDPLGGTGAAAAFPVSIRYDWDPVLPGSSMRNPYWETVFSGGGQVTTFGSAGCDLTFKETCGPDLENGYGTLVSGTFGGKEWLLASGSQTSGAVYFYASSAWTTVGGADALDFAFLDLRGTAFPNTSKRIGAAAVAGDALWVGYVDQGGAGPVVHVLTRAPAYPGIEASQPDGELVDVRADLMPGVGVLGSPANPAAYVGLDAVASFGGRVYLANNGGVVRTTVPGTPRPYADAPADWAAATPSAPQWTGRTSVELPPSGDLRPFDRAVPAMAAFRGSLFLVRNVLSLGGVASQLWRCTPAPGADGCAPGDWALVTPGPAADLTQLGDATNGPATVLVATPRHLYVGFDNPKRGAQLFRTDVADPAAVSAWTGQGGCAAGAPGCVGLGGAGLGDAASVRFVDAAVVTDATDASHLYVVVGDPVASPPVPLRVVEIPD